MSLRIYVCENEHAANRIIEIQKDLLKNPELQSRQLREPDIVIFDYTKNPNNPTQVNDNKVCVVFDD